MKTKLVLTTILTASLGFTAVAQKPKKGCFATVEWKKIFGKDIVKEVTW